MVPKQMGKSRKKTVEAIVVHKQDNPYVTLYFIEVAWLDHKGKRTVDSFTSTDVAWIFEEYGLWRTIIRPDYKHN